MISETCRDCGKAFEYEPVYFEEGGRELFHRTVCFPCAEAREQKRLEEEKWRRDDDLKRDWFDKCPPLYRDSDVKRLPQKQFEEVMKWELGPRGIVMHGQTGRSKTRCAFLLLKKIHMAGASVVAFHANNSFEHQCSIEFGHFAGEQWIKELSRKDVVFFDDLGKFKLTERVEAELFGLIEMRNANLKPIIATTNFVGATLEKKLSEDRGAPLVRRLKEFCEIITF